MMNRLKLIYLFLILLSLPTFAEEPTSLGSKQSWDSTDYTTVIGYRFENQTERSSFIFASDNTTFIWHGKVDLEKLTKLKLAEKTLNKKQTKQLITKTFSNLDDLPRVACYVPHHIFVFYGDDHIPLRAIEICFQCNAVKPSHPSPENKKWNPDLKALAQLCDELGLWNDKISAKNYKPTFTE